MNYYELMVAEYWSLLMNIDECHIFILQFLLWTTMTMNWWMSSAVYFRASLPLLPEVFQPRVLFGLVLFAVLLLPEKRTQRIFGSLPCHYHVITPFIRMKPCIVDSYCEWWRNPAPVCKIWQLWTTANHGIIGGGKHLPGAGFRNHPQYHQQVLSRHTSLDRAFSAPGRTSTSSATPLRDVWMSVSVWDCPKKPGNPNAIGLSEWFSIFEQLV